MSKAKFEKAVEIVQSLPKQGALQPADFDKLYFYKYYKQATIGDVNIDRPGLFDFEGKAKWDSWNSVKGTSKEVAWEKYVEKLIELLKAAGDDEGSKKRLAELEATA